MPHRYAFDDGEGPTAEPSLFGRIEPHGQPRVFVLANITLHNPSIELRGRNVYCFGRPAPGGRREVKIYTFLSLEYREFHTNPQSWEFEMFLKRADWGPTRVDLYPPAPSGSGQKLHVWGTKAEFP